MTNANDTDRFMLSLPEGARIGPKAIEAVRAAGGELEEVLACYSAFIFTMPARMPLFARLTAQVSITKACGYPRGTKIELLRDAA